MRAKGRCGIKDGVDLRTCGPGDVWTQGSVDSEKM